MTTIKPQKERLAVLYDLTMSGLAVMVVAILFAERRLNLSPIQAHWLHIIDYSVWVVFVLDYAIRLFLAQDKLAFFKSNIIELIAILPFNAFFKGLRALRIFRIVRATRLLRIFRLARAFAYLNRLNKKLSIFIQTNNFHRVLWLTCATIILGTMAISYLEDMTISDAIWWSFVTTTTVGYGDISPASVGGRLVAVLLMIVGIGFLGMLTGTIATYFLSDPAETPYRDDCLGQIICRLQRFDDLSATEIDDICNVLRTLGQRNEPGQFDLKAEEPEEAVCTVSNYGS